MGDAQMKMMGAIKVKKDKDENIKVTQQAGTIGAVQKGKNTVQVVVKRKRR